MTNKEPKWQKTPTLHIETMLLDFIDKNGRPPTTKEVMEMTGIRERTNAAQHLKHVREIFRHRLDEKLDEVSGKLIDRIKIRLEDQIDPMRDENLIKLLEFCYPKKIESKTTMESTVNVRGTDELKEELENYRKLFPETSDPPQL